MSAASDEVDYLENVTALESARCEGFTIAQDRAVVFHYHKPGIDSQRAKQLAKRTIPWNLPRGSVHRQRDRPVRARRLHHTPKYSG
jgi:hypothetical protein